MLRIGDVEVLKSRVSQETPESLPAEYLERLAKVLESLQEVLTGGVPPRPLTGLERIRIMTEAEETQFEATTARSQRLYRRVVLLDKQRVADTTARITNFASMISGNQFFVWARNRHNQTVRLQLIGRHGRTSPNGATNIFLEIPSESARSWGGLPWVPWVGLEYQYLTAPTDSTSEDYLTLVVGIQEGRSR